MKAQRLIICLMFLLIGGFSFGQTISNDNMTSNKGETRAKGSYHLYKSGNNIKLDVNFDVRKSGMSGTGKGAYGFVIFDDNFEPVFEINKGLTVGARVPQGVNSKDWNQSLTITGEKARKMEKEGVILAFNVNAFSDKLGIPTSLNEWKDAVTESLNFGNEIMDLTVGESMKRGDWKFVKLLATGN
ncbi:hypothetical protein [Salegentibacter sp. T436]|uniref:hypothetical protein n=1 Tax=Salegentibacter sp. T436 TaxID=1729720 RepID=UPI000AF7A2F4|nr:hypothetical protein [Salegentibacter sp. T436]